MPPRRPPSTLRHAVGVLALIAHFPLQSGCDNTYVNPVPSADEEAFAMASAMNEVIALGVQDDGGLFWTETEESGALVAPGVATGVAGVARGLLAGALELRREGLPTSETEVKDPLTYFAYVQSAADWLVEHADETPVDDLADPLATALSWNQCIDVGLDPCPDSIVAPATGHSRGVAGIGLFFLDLYALYLDDDVDFPSPSDAARSEYLEVAEAAAAWLRLKARPGDDGGLYWAETEPALSDGIDPAAFTGLDRGAAGIGYFFLRLSERSDDGATYLETARQAGLWLQSQLAATDGLIPMGTSSQLTSPGFYSGNAGIAYFFLALAEALEDDEALVFQTSARTLFERLSGEGVLVRDELLGGATWQTLNLPPSADASSTYTDVGEGNAGIGWAYLQGSTVLGPSLRITAEQAATWLSNPEIAHFYQGLGFWPWLIEPWSDVPRPPAGYSQTSGPELWSGVPEGLWIAGEATRAISYAPGLLRGGAGIGLFLLSMRETEDDCYAQLATQASRWLYYRGQESGTSRRWRWPVSAVHLISAREEYGPVAAGYHFGMAGIIEFLAHDRAARSDTPGGSYPLLGFRPLGAAQGETSRNRESR